MAQLLFAPLEGITSRTGGRVLFVDKGVIH